jgi:hypothetical protein
MKEEIKKTSKEWEQELFPWNTIMDYDGWDRKDLYYSFYVERITEAEFQLRYAISTVMINAMKHDK